MNEDISCNMSLFVMSDKTPIVVVDWGSGTSKVGFAGENIPRSVFPTVIGRLKYIFGPNSELKDVYVGDEARSKSSMLVFTHPIEYGAIADYDEIELLWNHILKNELNIEAKEHGVLLSDCPVPESTQESRNKLAEIMFEKFCVKSFYIENQSVLSLLSVGHKTGVVVDSGYDKTLASCVIEGKLVRESTQRMKIGGKDMTNYLQKILLERCIDIKSIETVKDIKEKISYVAYDFDTEITKSQTTSECDATYSIPDHDPINLSNERFRCPELLFKPHFSGFTFDGIDQVIIESIAKCEKDNKAELLNNIFLVGGSTLFQGFPERLERSLSRLYPADTIVKCSAPPERKYSVWSGGSILASLSSFEQTAITKEEYDQTGIAIIAQKCL